MLIVSTAKKSILANTGAFMETDINVNMAARLLESLGPAIVRGDYAAKPFPIEAEAAELFGVSRTVSREAIKSLIAKGMLESRPRVGQLVQPREKWNILDADVQKWMVASPIATTFLREIADVRKGIEPMAAGLATLSGTTESLSMIENAFFELKQADGAMLAIALHRFHDAVVLSANNSVLSKLQRTMSLPIRNLTAMVARSGELNIDQYAAVVNAVRARDVVRAETATRWLLDDEGRIFADANYEAGDRAAPASVHGSSKP
jgi:DNA-binding FadR family transcriptional regulator